MKRIQPGPGQESVWDYPRPPRLEKFSGHIRIQHLGITLVDSNKTFRVLETSHPPVYYIPQEDIEMQYLRKNVQRNTFCEWKGMAAYYDWIGEGTENPRIAWFYPKPSKKFEEITKHLAFYPSKLEACYVNEELVQAQEGDFYGGWITSNIVGPFKGPKGTWGW